jgi:hypothetical protein
MCFSTNEGSGKKYGEKEVSNKVVWPRDGSNKVPNIPSFNYITLHYFSISHIQVCCKKKRLVG